MKEIAIVTGGSSGLGYEIAKKLLKEGKNVCLISREEEGIKKAYKKLEKITKQDLIYEVGSVSNENFVMHLYEEIEKKYVVTHLYNVAGIGKFGPPELTTKKMVEEVLDANLVGLILMSSYALQYMKEQNQGTIVNILSSAAKKGNANESLYCAAKWGARGYTESLITWSKGTNIKIVGVYPGGMNTPFWEKETGQKPDTSKFMSPEEVAEQIVFSTLSKDTIKITDMSIDKI